MKMFVASALVLLVALVGAIQAPAQEAPPDFGEADLLVIGCEYAKARAAEELLGTTWCRRAAPEEIDGYKATVHLRLKIEPDVGRVLVDVRLRKSLWWVDSWFVAGPG